MFEFDRLIFLFKDTYYTSLVMLAIELTALVVTIMYGRKTRIGRAFIFYIVFDFSILIIFIFLRSHSGISPKFRNHFINYGNDLIALTELLVYYYYFSILLLSDKIKILMKSLAILFSVIIVIYILTRFSFLTIRYSYISYLVGAAEFIFLLPPCLFYFYKILSVNSETKLFKRPSFWIVSGIFFYSMVSVPYYLLNDYVSNNYKELTGVLAAALFYVPFTLNFSFLIKAFLCKKHLTI